MKPRTIWALATLVAIGGGGTAYYYWPGPASAPPGPGAEPSPAVAAPEPEEPKIRHPIARDPESAPPATTKQSADGGPAKQSSTSAVDPLPTLDASDPEVKEEVGAIVGSESLERLFNVNNLVRRIVVTVDNLPRRQVPPRYIPTAPVAGKFQAEGEEGHQILSEKNYQRYSTYVRLLESVDIKALVAVYVFLYPLFQEAYEDLGYPDAYFNDRLVEAIDDLLAAPEPQGPIRLVRPSVMFKFADPELERLSAGKKILIRMGPDQARRVKERLKLVRRELTRSERAAEGAHAER